MEIVASAGTSTDAKVYFAVAFLVVNFTFEVTLSVLLNGESRGELPVKHSDHRPERGERRRICSSNSPLPPAGSASVYLLLRRGGPLPPTTSVIKPAYTRPPLTHSAFKTCGASLCAMLCRAAVQKPLDGAVCTKLMNFPTI